MAEPNASDDAPRDPRHPDAAVRVAVTPLGAVEAVARPHPLRPWERVWPRAPKPEGAAYGFFDGKEAFGVEREGLVSLVSAAPIPVAVWAPETDAMVPPEELPWLLQPLRDRLEADATAGLMVPAVIVVFVVAGRLASPEGLRLDVNVVLLAMVATTWAAFRLWEKVRARRLSPEQFRALVHRAAYARWLRAQPWPYTKLLLGLIAAAFVAQMLSGGGWPAAAMSNAAVSAGEWWRLLTSGFLHGGIVHAGMNGLALALLGREMEAHGARPLLPLVFLASVAGGNLLGLWLSPADRLAVGASGGVLGVVGFLLVLGWRRAPLLPAGYTGLLLADVGLIAVMGAVGWAFIDNAGHLGGLLTGTALGLLSVPRAREEPWTPGPAARAAGVLAAILCVAAATAAAGVMLRGAAGA